MEYCDCFTKKPFQFGPGEILICGGCGSCIKKDTVPRCVPIDKLELLLEPDDYAGMSRCLDGLIAIEKANLEYILEWFDGDTEKVIQREQTCENLGKLSGILQERAKMREELIESTRADECWTKKAGRLQQKIAAAASPPDDERARKLSRLIRMSEVDFSQMKPEHADPLGGDRIVAKIVGFGIVCGLVRRAKTGFCMVRVFEFANFYGEKITKKVNNACWKPFTKSEWDIPEERIIVEHVTESGIKFCVRDYFHYSRPSLMDFSTGYCYHFASLPDDLKEVYSGELAKIRLVDDDSDVTQLYKVVKKEPTYILLNLPNIRFVYKKQVLACHLERTIPNPFYCGVLIEKDGELYILRVPH
jgi:hypothetical protein